MEDDFEARPVRRTTTQGTQDESLFGMELATMQPRMQRSQSKRSSKGSEDNSTVSGGGSVDDQETLKSPLPDGTECNICYENPRQTRLPCGHSFMCKPCTVNMMYSSGHCPVCRQSFSRFWHSEEFAQQAPFDHSAVGDEAPVEGEEKPICLSWVAEMDRRYETISRPPGHSPQTRSATLTMNPNQMAINRNTRQMRDGRSSMPCCQITCCYLTVFAISIGLVFAGAITTNWECESRNCLCNQDLSKNDIFQKEELMNVTSCALICSCLSLESDPVAVVNTVWREPEDTGNQIFSDKCSAVPLDWESMCSTVRQQPEFIDGDCLGASESHIPCGGPSRSYYLFTVGWYTIILLTNVLMFLCFCYCFGLCRNRVL